jgi:hypothetical protein
LYELKKLIEIVPPSFQMPNSVDDPPVTLALVAVVLRFRSYRPPSLANVRCYVALEDDKIDFPLKEALLVLPLFASALAVSFEIGSFIPISSAAFSYFSLAEHLSFATSGLPIAIMLSSSSAIYWMLLPIMADRLARRKRTISAAGFIRLIVFVLGAVWTVGGVYFRFASFTLMGVAVMAGCAATFLPVHKMSRSAAAVAIASFALILAIELGVDTTRTTLNDLNPTPAATVEFNDKFAKLIVLRSGEKGVLFYDPKLGTFSFEKWDEIKKIDWPRVGLATSFENAFRYLFKAPKR